MNLLVDASWGAAVFLLSLRLGALFVLSPIWGVAPVPPTFRVLLLLAMSAVLVSASPSLPPVPATMASFGLAAATELLAGATLAFGVFAAFAAFSFAGKVLDVQIGFGIGSVFDPVTNAHQPLVGTFLNVLAVMLFFAVDGHHALMRGIAYSLEALPLGTMLAAVPATAFVTQFGTMFLLSLLIAAPVMFCLLLVEAGLAVVSRNLPQMNLFIVAVPIKIFVGLVVLAATTAYVGPVAGKVFASIFRFWESVLAHG